MYDIVRNAPGMRVRFAPRLYTDLFFALMKIGGRSAARRAYSEFVEICEMGEDGKLVGPRSYNFLFVLLSRAGMVEEAVNVKKGCFQNGYYLNRYSYNAYLNACAKSYRIDDAFGTLREMAEVNVPPDVVSFNVLISCCVRSGDVDVALNILARMRDWGICPDIYSYNSVVNGLRRNRMLDEAFELVAQMERDAGGEETNGIKGIVEIDGGVSPDLVTYNTLLSGLACLEIPDFERAMRVKKHMEKRGIQCNEVSYNALMATATKAEYVNQAFEIYEEMLEMSIKPNCECFTTLITLCGRARLVDRAFEVHTHMIASGIKANVITYNALLTACRHDDEGAGDRAMEVLAVMRKTENCDPDVITYSTVIDALGRDERFDEVRLLLAEMKEEGIAPNLVTFTSIISGMTRSGNLQGALDMLDTMKEAGIKPNVYTYSSLINGAAKRGEITTALDILHKMRQRNIKPSRVTYAMFFQLAVRVAKVDFLAKVIQELGEDERIGNEALEEIEQLCESPDMFSSIRSRFVINRIMGVVDKSLEEEKTTRAGSAVATSAPGKRTSELLD